MIDRPDGYAAASGERNGKHDQNSEMSHYVIVYVRRGRVIPPKLHASRRRIAMAGWNDTLIANCGRCERHLPISTSLKSVIWLGDAMFRYNSKQIPKARPSGFHTGGCASQRRIERRRRGDD
jgi:hypothetical protein